jgi:hypothetical protein
VTVSDEVEKCFEENPKLINKSLKEIAQFFMIQGQLRYSLLRETSLHKAQYFVNRLYDLNPEEGKRAMKEWKEASEIYDPVKKHLEEVSE